MKGRRYKARHGISPENRKNALQLRLQERGKAPEPEKIPGVASPDAVFGADEFERWLLGETARPPKRWPVDLHASTALPVPITLQSGPRKPDFWVLNGDEKLAYFLHYDENGDSYATRAPAPRPAAEFWASPRPGQALANVGASLAEVHRFESMTDADIEAYRATMQRSWDLWVEKYAQILFRSLVDGRVVVRQRQEVSDEIVYEVIEDE